MTAKTLRHLAKEYSGMAASAFNDAAACIEKLEADNAVIRECLGASLRDSDRLDWLEQNPCQATINGLPPTAKAYSIITELPLRVALDVMRKKEP